MIPNRHWREAFKTLFAGAAGGQVVQIQESGGPFLATFVANSFGFGLILAVVTIVFWVIEYVYPPREDDEEEDEKPVPQIAS